MCCSSQLLCQGKENADLDKRLQVAEGSLQKELDEKEKLQKEKEKVEAKLKDKEDRVTELNKKVALHHS